MQLQVYKGELIDRMKELISWDLCTTINSDDPPFFGGYVNENFQFWADELGLTAAQISQLARNSVEASFLEPSDKAAMVSALEAARLKLQNPTSTEE